MNKVLVTGVAGFIGSHVASRFRELGHHVIGVDDLSTGKFHNIPKGIDFIQADLASVNIDSILPQGCEIILHLAGQSSGEVSFDNPVYDLEKNTVTTLNLIKYGIRNKSTRLVYASSMSVYGEVPPIPISETHTAESLSCYGVSKLASEGYLKVFQKQLTYVSLRMFNVYGPGQNMDNLRQGMVSIYLSQALNKGEIEVKGDISRYRDFIYIDDVVEAWVRAAFYCNAANQVINVGTGIKTTIDELLGLITSELPGCHYFVKQGTPGDQTGIYADTNKLASLLNMSKFTPLGLGLRAFIHYSAVN